jgi:hypothetical protein
MSSYRCAFVIATKLFEKPLLHVGQRPKEGGQGRHQQADSKGGTLVHTLKLGETSWAIWI